MTMEISSAKEDFIKPGINHMNIVIHTMVRLTKTFFAIPEGL